MNRINRIEENGPKGTSTVAEQKTEAGVDGQNSGSANGAKPFVPDKQKQQPSLKDRFSRLTLGGLIVLAVVVFVLGRLPHRSGSPKQALSSNKNIPSSPNNATSSTASPVPILSAGRTSDQDSDHNLMHPDQLARTAQRQQLGRTTATNLGGVQPFDNQGTSEPPPYQAGAQPASMPQESNPAGQGVEAKSEREAMDKPSLVFVRTNTAATTASKSESSSGQSLDLGIGLPPGTRLRARLESAVSTAVQTPVVAVIEYNYERDGEMVVPAGAKAFGHLEAADRSGLVGVRFDSLMLPDGSTVKMDAAATDLELRPVRGRVEGKHTGKNILVRSLTGVGEIAATLVGRGSLNQSLSEGDLLRERVSNNIGQAGDEAVSRLAITERLAVTIPANTEIYVVLEKATKTTVAPQTKAPGTGQAVSGSPSLQELRQLIQLQRELNQSTNIPNSNQ